MLQPSPCKILSAALSCLHRNVWALGLGYSCWDRSLHLAASFGRNYKEAFCPAAKNPDKIFEHLNGKGGKKGQFSPLPSSWIFSLSPHSPAALWGNDASLLVLCTFWSPDWLLSCSYQSFHTTHLVPVLTKMPPPVACIPSAGWEAEAGSPGEGKYSAVTNSHFGLSAAHWAPLLLRGQK